MPDQPSLTDGDVNSVPGGDSPDELIDALKTELRAHKGELSPGVTDWLAHKAPAPPGLVEWLTHKGELPPGLQEWFTHKGELPPGLAMRLHKGGLGDV